MKNVFLLNLALILGVAANAQTLVSKTKASDTVVFQYIRFNPSITSFGSLAEKMAGEFGYTAELSIDKDLAELLRLRVAQKNECAYCVILHAKEARKLAINAAKVDNISSWYNSMLFSDKEKAALAYCDALTVGIDPNFQKYHDALTVYFSDKEIAEIAGVVINMNVWTRLKLASGDTPFFSK